MFKTLLSLLMVLGLGGCVQEGTGPLDQEMGAEMPTLIYYTIGKPDRDLAKVTQALNELAAEEIGARIDYRKIEWNQYVNRMDLLIDSGQAYDIAYAHSYAKNAKRGIWLDLTPYLAPGEPGAPLTEVVDPIFWEGVRVGGKTYGVPTNKELAVAEQWMYPERLVDKYRIDVSAYRSLESLEPLLEMIVREEPEYQPMQLDKDANNFFRMYGYEYISDKGLPLMVKSLAEAPQIVNPFETPEGLEILQCLRRYYLAGYINSEAALTPPASLVANEKVFLHMASGGPYSAPTWSQLRNYPVVAQIVTDPVVTSESTQAGVMSINQNSRWPEECVRFLTLINTDPAVRNLLAYGIEGTHYRLDQEDRVLLTDPEGYSGVNYTQGNWFLLKTLGGPYPEPPDKWARYRRYNRSVLKSKILGFSPDLSPWETQRKAVAAVCSLYYPPLMTGSVDVDRYLPAFIEALDQAGLKEIQAGLQAQLEAWQKEQQAQPEA